MNIQSGEPTFDQMQHALNLIDKKELQQKLKERTDGF